MLEPVNPEYNRQNFKYISLLIRNIDAFPFFGTLLGLTRQSDVLEVDDDVDFYVDIKHRDELINLIKQTHFFFDEQNPWTCSPHFIQITTIIDNCQTGVDFYFYEDAPDRDFILERWNFTGLWERPENWMKIPKELIFPLEKTLMLGCEIKMPSNPSGCCAFLYGPHWRRPLKKSEGQYRIDVTDGIPNLTILDPTVVMRDSGTGNS